jgi:flagellar basal body rod protein FlgB
MNFTSLPADNISELLSKIIEFTQIRQKTLTQNINNIHNPEFVPKDIAVEEFSALLHEAIDEHTQNGRLLLRDTENIKFGLCGSFKVKPIVDEYAKELLEEDVGDYLELQIDKIIENSFNQRVAAQLLKERQEAILAPL